MTGSSELRPVDRTWRHDGRNLCDNFGSRGCRAVGEWVRGILFCFLWFTAKLIKEWWPETGLNRRRLGFSGPRASSLSCARLGARLKSGGNFQEWWPETGLNRRRLGFSGPRASPLSCARLGARLKSGGNFQEWWPETGLNRRRRPFQGRALPLSYLASVQTSEVVVGGADSGVAGGWWG